MGLPPVAATGALYFAVLFALGFALGSLRVLWLVPRLGERWAELAEMPIMLFAIVLAARRIFSRPRAPHTRGARLAAGLLALALLLSVEFSVVLWLRGLTLEQYFATRDPVSGAAYVALLLVFAFLPALLPRR